MYHRIADDPFDPWGLAVSPANFADQLRWLAANREVLPLADFAARHRDGTLPPNAAAITFDDGYESTASVAAPLLEKAGLTATVFLPVTLVESGEPFWWDELQKIVFGTPAASLRLDGNDFALGEQCEADSSWAPGLPPRTPRQKAFQAIWGTLRLKAQPELQSAMGALREQAGEVQWRASERPMSREQVLAIASGPVEFGSHALTHPSLPKLSSAAKAVEIGDSVERCTALTGVNPRTFAYPYGDRDAESERLVEEAGFACACATEGRSVAPGSSLFALPRIGVGNWTGRFLANAIGAL